MADSIKPPPKVLQTSEVNSLLDLQSEFLRKKKEASAIRAARPNIIGVFHPTKNNIFALSKVEKEEKLNVREARSVRIRHNEEALRKEEEENTKRRRILEEKSAIYDRMSKGETLVHEDGKEAEFLVNFQLKKKEIEERMSREQAPSTSTGRGNSDTCNEYEEESETPLIVHYDPNEEKGRVFGPSHVSLAGVSEEKRQRKMADLKAISAETAANRRKHKDRQRAKRVEERKRINRLRARKGLAPLQSSSDSEPDEAETDEKDQEIDLDTIPLPSEGNADGPPKKPANETPYGIREWDQGKVGYTRWISAEREKRVDDFRPPSFYYNSK